MNVLELFAGAGGGILGSMFNGHRTVCAVEYNAYARSVLLARQNDRTLSPFPIWDDVRTFDGKPWKGIVDCVSGGFPCQDISSAGKGEGIDGEKSGLWKEQMRIICEIDPWYAKMENSPRLTSRGLHVVLADLAEMGFDAEWGVLSGGEAGACHERDRIWILASNTNRAQREGRKLPSRTYQEYANFGGCTWWKDKPGIHGVDDGVAYRMDRLKAIGNGQVPIVAATAFKILSGT